MIVILAKAEAKINDELEILSRVRQDLKKDSVISKLFKSKDKKISLIDGIPIDFSDEIDVSAKTINSRVILNKKLLHEPYDILYRYAVHEVVHSLQHIDIDGTSDNYEGFEYLDRPDELEAFQYQIESDKNRRSEEEVVEYVEDLVDYHEIPDEHKENKKEQLLERT